MTRLGNTRTPAGSADSADEAAARREPAHEVGQPREAMLGHTSAGACAEKLDEAIMTLSLAGEITSWNGGAELTYGYAADEVIGELNSILVPEELLDETWELVSRVGMGESVGPVETRRQRKDGRIIDVSLSISPVRDEAGTVVAIVGSSYDITARGHAEHDRDLAIARAERLAEFGTWDLDFVTEEITWSEGMYRIYALDPREWSPDMTTAFATIAPRDEAMVRAEVVRATREHRPYVIEHGIVRGDGVERVVRATAEVIYAADGTPLRMVGADQDITVEIERRHELQARADRLRQLNRELARSNDELEQFAYLASHDLSEPLRAITIPIQYVVRHYQNRPLDEKANQFLSYAVNGAARMREMIDALLAYSRVGRVEGPLTEVDTSRLVTDVLDSLRSLVFRSRAQVVTDAHLPVVLGEPAQLALVFQNLISNAIKFVAPDVRPQVSVSAERVGAMWRFSVTDNGIGIPDTQRDGVFTMFKRLQEHDGYPGVGIGLAIVKKVIERHGGKIGIEDAPAGTGTRVWFTLPAEDAKRSTS